MKKKFNIGDHVIINCGGGKYYSHFRGKTVHGASPFGNQKGEILEIDEDANIYLVKYSNNRRARGMETMHLGFHAEDLELDKEVSESISYMDNEERSYYHVTIGENFSIIRTDSKDDEHRWTGPTIHDYEDELMFEDGSDVGDGAYFGGDGSDDEKVIVRLATADEINWLDDCIDEGELVEKPKSFIDKYLAKPVQYITELTPDMVGKKVTCKIERKLIKDAKIQLESNNYFICQDLQKGASCKDKLGYKYSWSAGNGLKGVLERRSVTEFQLAEPIAQTLPEGVDPEMLVQLIINDKT